LTVAMKMLAGKGGDTGRPKYLLFMTDGQPTIGKTQPAEILDDVRKANTGQARLFAFGVGYDVNTRLLDNLAEQNSGKSDYVKPKEAADPKITSLYAKIKSPVMTHLNVNVQGLRFLDMYPRKIDDLFEGDQLVLVGRYEIADPAGMPRDDEGYHAQLVLTGLYDGKDKAFEYPVTIRPAGKDTRYQFVDKLWAIRRVGFLLDAIQLHGQNKELMDELIRLSKEYGIMTPYTSFLADERVALKDDGAHRTTLEKVAQDKAKIVDGREAQMDAVARRELRLAKSLAGPATPAQAPDEGGGGGGGGGTVVFGNTKGDKYEQAETEVVRNVRQVGNQAIYGRGNVWIAANASHVDLERDAGKIKEIKRFTDEYFALVRANNVTENQLLGQQRPHEELVLALRGQVYRIR